MSQQFPYPRGCPERSHLSTLCFVYEIMTGIFFPVSIYVVTSLLSFVTMAVGPLSYEMGCEAAFPVKEEVSSAIIGIASNIGTMVFLFITMIPNIGNGVFWLSISMQSLGTRWIPFSYAACTLIVMPLMCVYKDVRKRLRCDLSGVVDDSFSVAENRGVINVSYG